MRRGWHTIAMVSLLPPNGPNEEELSLRRALLEDDELLQFLREVNKPRAKRQPRILPDLTDRSPSHK